MKNKGFTLIEILVVVTIIGILSVVAITSFSSVNSKTKDVKKKADIDALANAYELKYSGKDRLYQPLTEADFSGPIPSSPTYSRLIADSAPAYRICANLASDSESCSSPSPSCYCKESIHGDLALLSSPPPGRGGGGDGGAPAAPSPSPGVIPTSTSYKRVFITSTTYNGSNLGGLSGADQKCQERANAFSLGGVAWKAWLSDSLNSASSRLEHAEVPYKLLNGTQIANNWTDLVDGNLAAQINITENGKLVPSGQSRSWTWTNTKSDGSIFGTGYSCANWTSQATSGVAGHQGSSEYKDLKWTDNGVPNCSLSLALFCFEQQSASSSIPCTNGYKDHDKDGYGAGDSGCYEASVDYNIVSNKDDCYDSNAVAKPGQTSWFFSHRGDGSFDYNCDGVSTKQYDCLTTFPLVSCTNTQPSGGSGWSVSAVPNCGQSASYRTCYWGPIYSCGSAGGNLACGFPCASATQYHTSDRSNGQYCR